MKIELTRTAQSSSTKATTNLALRWIRIRRQLINHDKLDGRLTQNGLFEAAAIEYKASKRHAERVRYEKIRSGIWSYNGIFHLLDVWTENAGNRSVFKFRLEAVEGEEDLERPVPSLIERRRIIPADVKIEVWKRDGGKCVACGARNELHFDHDLRFSLGGTSVTAANVQLLCARHNLSKGAKIL